MSDKCENIEKCGFFLRYEGSSEATNQGWIRMFCCSVEKSLECKRKLYKQQTEQAAPDNMTPTGTMLSRCFDDERLCRA